MENRIKECAKCRVEGFHYARKGVLMRVCAVCHRDSLVDNEGYKRARETRNEKEKELYQTNEHFKRKRCIAAAIACARKMHRDGQPSKGGVVKYHSFTRAQLVEHFAAKGQDVGDPDLEVKRIRLADEFSLEELGPDGQFTALENLMLVPRKGRHFDRH